MYKKLYDVVQKFSHNSFLQETQFNDWTQSVNCFGDDELFTVGETLQKKKTWTNDSSKVSNMTKHNKNFH